MLINKFQSNFLETTQGELPIKGEDINLGISRKTGKLLKNFLVKGWYRENVIPCNALVS